MNPAALAARQKNERRIIEYVVHNGETSRVTLATALGLSTATVTNIVTDLLERNLLFESRQEKSTVGRKTTLLKFNSELLFVLTVEITTEQSLHLCICNLNGTQLASETVQCSLQVTASCPKTQVLKNVIRALTEFLNKQLEQVRSQVKLIGLCLHGMVNATQTFDVPGLNWKNLNLTMPLQVAMGIPVYAAIGDNQASFLGAAGGRTDALLINMGTGGQVSMSGFTRVPLEDLEMRPIVNDAYLIAGSMLCGGRAYAMLEGFIRDVASLSGYEGSKLYEAMNSVAMEAIEIENPWKFDTRFSGTRRQPEIRGGIQGIGIDNFDAKHLIGGLLNGMVDEAMDLYERMLSTSAKKMDEYI